MLKLGISASRDWQRDGEEELCSQGQEDTVCPELWEEISSWLKAVTKSFGGWFRLYII